MTKSELAKALVKRVPEINLATALKAIDASVEIISETLVSGEEVTLRGFATIKPVTLAARKARDIKEGKVIDVPARRSVKFRISKELKELLNNGTVD